MRIWFDGFLHSWERRQCSRYICEFWCWERNIRSRKYYWRLFKYTNNAQINLIWKLVKSNWLIFCSRIWRKNNFIQNDWSSAHSFLSIVYDLTCFSSKLHKSKRKSVKNFIWMLTLTRSGSSNGTCNTNCLMLQRGNLVFKGFFKINLYLIWFQ